MKKKLFAIAVTAAMIAAVFVPAMAFAGEIGSGSDWAEAGAFTKGDGKVTVLKGHDAYSNELRGQNLADGVEVRLNVEVGNAETPWFCINTTLKTEDMATPDSDATTAEIDVLTARVGDEYTVSSTVFDEKITLPGEGIYTYIWNIKKDDGGKITATVRIEDYGTVLGEMNTIVRPIKEVCAKMGAVWVYGLPADNYALAHDVVIYDNLPYADTTALDEINIPSDLSKYTDDSAAALKGVLADIDALKVNGKIRYYDQADLDNLVLKLKEAVSGLEEKPIENNPVTPSENNPQSNPEKDGATQTGDEANMIPFVVLMILAAGAGTATFVKRRVH